MREESSIQKELSIPANEPPHWWAKMIFKYCAGLEEDKATVLRSGEPNSEERTRDFNEESSDSRRREYKIANTVLRYCSCAFRCRQPVDIGREEEDSISTIVTTINATPVIPLALNQSDETMYVVTILRNIEFVRILSNSSPILLNIKQASNEPRE
ncbi:uncharacterized protein LOC113464917 [Ceratina calcarata]|uniref:Uncharacterized protein LOC113464917 n=1 Tax=Ceratina calcarata TaxID=156304 RepID=A0AAJ7WFH1_9HYME|nr:uncharacterized protein LOC113464917 [Ceratina calcarata]XP_026673469.1 uncharacterized protein LOC113464917 [Ceratina calcarata]